MKLTPRIKAQIKQEIEVLGITFAVYFSIITTLVLFYWGIGFLLSLGVVGQYILSASCAVLVIFIHRTVQEYKRNQL
jgi:hypothetical protein